MRGAAFGVFCPSALPRSVEAREDGQQVLNGQAAVGRAGAADLREAKARAVGRQFAQRIFDRRPQHLWGVRLRAVFVDLVARPCLALVGESEHPRLPPRPVTEDADVAHLVQEKPSTNLWRRSGAETDESPIRVAVPVARPGPGRKDHAILGKPTAEVAAVQVIEQRIETGGTGAHRHVFAFLRALAHRARTARRVMALRRAADTPFQRAFPPARAISATVRGRRRFTAMPASYKAARIASTVG